MASSMTIGMAVKDYKVALSLADYSTGMQLQGPRIALAVSTTDYAVEVLEDDYSIVTAPEPNYFVAMAKNDCTVKVAAPVYMTGVSVPVLCYEISTSEVADGDVEETLIPIMCGPIVTYVYV